MTNFFKKPKILIGTGLLVYFLLLLWRNKMPVEFDLLFFDFKVPKTVLILVSAGLGSLATLLGQYLWKNRRS